MAKEVVVLKGFVATIISPYIYKDNEYEYDPAGAPQCTVQLDGEFDGKRTFDIKAFLEHGQEYELVLRPVNSQAAEEVEAPTRKFNDDI